MSGWRMGWMVYPEPFHWNRREAHPVQHLGRPGLSAIWRDRRARSGEDFVAEFVERCRAGREIVSRRLARMPRVREVASNGSFYSMFEVEGVTDTLQFCKDLVLKAGVGLAPGIAFGKGAETLIRLCYAKSAATLETAMDRLEAYLAEG